MPPPLRWYLTSTAFFLIPGGIQSVMFSWLVAMYLHEAPARLGLAQMAGQLPMVLLILFGGLVGDRVDQRKLLIRLHLMMMLPPLCVAAVIGANALVYEVLLVWAVVGGMLGSFAGPARDALLSRVAGRDIQRVVMLVTAVQFGVQILGFALGSIADRVGPVALLCTQSVSMLLCALTTSRMPAAPPANTEPNTEALTVRLGRILRDIGEGIGIAWRSPSIRPAVALAFAVGVFFASSYVIILPLMARDVYHTGAQGIALAFGSNMLGTVLTIFVLMWRGGIERPGRALLGGASISCCILSLLHFEMPEWAFYGVSFIWGMCGGISMTMGRSIVQEAAPASHRARLMSVYGLGMMGGMPLGSPLLGWFVGMFGARDAVLIPVAGMVCTLLIVATTTRLWSVTRGQPTPVAA